MQPKTHAFVITAAVERARAPWLERHLPDLLAGHEEEDDFHVFGLRLRAPGLTHSYRPGSRFGELWAPSARTCLLRCVERARSAVTAEAAARWLGRACHLLGDLAVPARTRGVWHLLGDPLETFWENHARELAGFMSEVPTPEHACPEDHVEALARASAAHPADTTRTPWGAFVFRRWGRGLALEPDVVENQARALLPLAVAHTSGLLTAEAQRFTAALHRD
jgi:hypothetical protein